MNVKRAGGVHSKQANDKYTTCGYRLTPEFKATSEPVNCGICKRIDEVDKENAKE